MLGRLPHLLDPEHFPTALKKKAASLPTRALNESTPGPGKPRARAMLENPIILAALICFLLGLVLSGLARVAPGFAIVSVVLPIIFLAGYVLTYQQVPDFPPIGATNKIFYIALAAALVGFAIDLLPRPANCAWRPLRRRQPSATAAVS